MTTMNQIFRGMFDDKVFYKNMLKIAVPIVIQSFISSFLNMVDTVMVGKLGETEIAAVGIANQYFFFFNMFLVGLCAGCGVFISQFWGKKDITNIKRILGIGMISASIISFVFMLVGFHMPSGIIELFNNDPKVIDMGAKYLRIVLYSYIFTGITFVYNFSLRSIGNTVKPMVISAAALVCNVFFNYALIFGKFGAPSMGVEGAALATLIARGVETTLFIVSIYGRKELLAASIGEMTDLTFEFIKKSYRTIFPVILNDICWGLGFLVYSAVYGRMGTQAVASVQICSTIIQLFMIVAFGMSGAAAVMVGNTIGAGNDELGMDYAMRFSILSVVSGIILGMFLVLVSPYLLDVFNVSSTVRSDSQIILYIASVMLFIRVFAVILIVGILRGGGDAKTAFLIEGFTMWFIGVPLTILGAFVFKFPVYIVYAMGVIEETAKCIMCCMRLRTGKWIKNVTHNM